MNEAWNGNPRVFELATSAGPVLFRAPSRIELAELWDGIPIIPEQDSGYDVDARPMAEKLADARRALMFADRLLSICAKRPHITLSPCISDEHLLDVADLGDEQRFEIMRELLARAGFSIEEADRVAPLGAAESR